MRSSIPLIAILVLILTSPGWPQEKSVRPGINDAYQKPDVAAFVERFEREGREVYDHRDKIVEACQLKPGMVIADVGAGTGLFTRLMSPIVGEKGRVYAVDIAKAFIKHIEQSCQAEKLSNVAGVVCRPDSVALPAESIDVALICDTYHHFEYPYKTMRSIHRALKPGGRVVLVEFHRIEGKSSDWILGHVRAGQETFVGEIETAGFEVVDELKFLDTSYCVRFKKSSGLTSSGHTADSIDLVKELLADKTAMLIDVREQGEWNAGHLNDAQLVPLSTLRRLAGNDDGRKQIAELIPKDRIIYCHCQSGGRVLAAHAILKELQYDIRPLRAGYPALLNAGFPPAE